MLITIKRKKYRGPCAGFKIQLFVVAQHSHNSRNSLVIKQWSFFNFFMENWLKNNLKIHFKIALEMQSIYIYIYINAAKTKKK